MNDAGAHASLPPTEPDDSPRILAERGITARALKDPEHLARIVAAGLRPDLFRDGYAKRVFTAHGAGVDLLDVKQVIAAGLVGGGHDYVELTRDNVEAVAQFSENLAAVVSAQLRDRRQSIADMLVAGCDPRAIADDVLDLAVLGPRNESKLLSRMLAAEPDPANPPPPDSPVFYVCEKLTNTTGNLGVISSPAKTGKTTVIGAHAAACLVADGIGSADADTLGIRSEPPRGKAVLIIDTEQSVAHACKLIDRALHRVGVKPENRPSWLRLFSFAGWSAVDLAQGLPELMEHVAKQHGGIHAALVDGGADFAVNVNDPEEAATLVAGWHALAIKHTCAIIIVVHSNEGAKADEVARGWLGKQLRRKAESNLQLKRTGDIITLFGATGQRHAPIFEREGPSFTWGATDGMYVSVSANPKTTRKHMDLQGLAAEAFGDRPRMRWKELRDAIKAARGCVDSTAETRIKDLESAGIIRTGPMGIKERVLPR